MGYPADLQEKYDALTPMQQKFVDVWNGEAKAAAALAGYSHPKKAGFRAMRHLAVKALISYKRDQSIQPGIMQVTALQEMWTGIATDLEIPLKHRLKASELLGKAQGAFIDRYQDISGPKIITVGLIDDRK